MNYKEYTPPVELAHLLECYWTNTLHPEDFMQEYDYIIPDGSIDAIIMLSGSYLRKDEQKQNSHLVQHCSFVPPFHHSVKVYQQPYTSCLVIRFKPEAIRRMTGYKLGDLNGQAYNLSDIMPELADLAMDEVHKKTRPSLIIGKINSWLLSKNLVPDRNPVVSRFITDSINQKGNISIRDFCSRMNLHKSTLQKNFRQHTGLSPKQYSRILRFNYLLRTMFYSPGNLTDACYEMGFFDQSHMNKEFKNFTGTSPSDFLAKSYAVPKLAAMAIANKHRHFSI